MPQHRPPLVVDLDGTLIPTDTLVEGVVRLLRMSPWLMLMLPLWLWKGRAFLKAEVARRSPLDVGTLPLRTEFVEWLHAEKALGRRLVLATAAHRSVAQAMATRLGLFDSVLSSDGNTNLKGRHKLEAVQAHIGTPFVYAGDSRADWPLWRAAQAAVLVGAPESLARAVALEVPIERQFDAVPAGTRAWAKALRMHQWVKNTLLFVPLLTAFAFTDAQLLTTLLVAFASISLSASATYIGNDLWDLENDRQHPRKRLRPFARGTLPIIHGVLVAAALLASGLVLASWVGSGFLVVLVVYLITTTAYSWVFKEYVLLDVLLLASLYTVRIVAGAVAAQLPLSSWLLAFSFFLFLSLALVKRCAELVLLQEQSRPASSGRDYRVSDLTVLWPLGIGAGLSSVVVFGLFISTPATVERFSTPEGLWLVAMGLVYWLGRLWIKTARGEMHDDPVVYALVNRGSRLTVMAMGAVFLAARFLPPMGH